MTTMNLNLEIKYKEGAGHYFNIYEVKGRVRGKRTHYESLQMFTNKEKAEEYKQTLQRIDKDLEKEFDYIMIIKEIVWID